MLWTWIKSINNICHGCEQAHLIEDSDDDEAEESEGSLPGTNSPMPDQAGPASVWQSGSTHGTLGHNNPDVPDQASPAVRGTGPCVLGRTDAAMPPSSCGAVAGAASYLPKGSPLGPEGLSGDTDETKHAKNAALTVPGPQAGDSNEQQPGTSWSVLAGAFPSAALQLKVNASMAQAAGAVLPAPAILPTIAAVDTSTGTAVQPAVQAPSSAGAEAKAARMAAQMAAASATSYRLHGLVRHVGGTPFYGHYVSDIYSEQVGVAGVW